MWDGVPGYEFDSRRSARLPPAGPGRTASRGPDPQGGPFWYTPKAGSALSQPAPVTPLAWLSDEQPRPGFEFDPDARTASLYEPGPYGPDLYEPATDRPAPVRSGRLRNALRRHLGYPDFAFTRPIAAATR